MKTIHTLCLFILTISIYLLLSPSQCSIDSFQNVRRENFAMNKRSIKRTKKKSRKNSNKKKPSKKKSNKKKPSKKKSNKRQSKSFKKSKRK
jgi:hypothetical protein